MLRSVELARADGGRISLGASLSQLAALHVARGELDAARAACAELIPLLEDGVNGSTTDVALHAEQIGVRDRLAKAAEATAARWTRWRKLIELMLDGDLRSAADDFAEIGTPTKEAELRRHAGRRFLEEGRRADGEVELEKALSFYRSVAATAHIAEIEALLGAAAQSESA
jgi:ATP/maltotriose-dependent transcriptional regulator MalT